MGALIKKSEARSGRHSFETSDLPYRSGLSIRQRNRPLLPPQSSKLAGMSLHGPSVWTGRALQPESEDLEVTGLALLYPALERNVCVPGHHGYPRASDLILGKALKGQSGHQFRDATARPFLHLLIPARRPRRESRLSSWSQL